MSEDGHKGTLVTAADVDTILVVPEGMEDRRTEFCTAVVAALQIVSDFAARYGWLPQAEEAFFDSVEIYRSQQEVWERIQFLNGVRDLPIPTDSLTAALEQRVLLAVPREEAERARPEYFRSDADWSRALAHEMIHRLHVRILGGDEERMGPDWFFEGFAVFGSGQPLGAEIEVNGLAEVLRLAHSSGRGSYARYAAALRFLAARIPLPRLVEHAATPDFENWLRLELGGEVDCAEPKRES